MSEEAAKIVDHSVLGDAAKVVELVRHMLSGKARELVQSKLPQQPVDEPDHSEETDQ